MLRLIACVSLILAGALAQSTVINYETRDGQTRSETVDQEGNVRGQYSYIDPSGKKITTKYSAGKSGFQVKGDHIPKEVSDNASGNLQQISSSPKQQSSFPGLFNIGQKPQPYSSFPELTAPQQSSLFTARPQQSFGQPASPSQLLQFGQSTQQGQPPGAAVQLSQFPSPSRFTAPLDIPQVGQQQYSTAPTQFPSAPPSGPAQGAAASPLYLQQLQGAPQFLLPNQIPNQFTPEQLQRAQLSFFNQIPNQFTSQQQQQLQGAPQFSLRSQIPNQFPSQFSFPGSQQLTLALTGPGGATQPPTSPGTQAAAAARLGAAQFPTVPSSPQLPSGTAPQFPTSPSGPSQFYAPTETQFSPQDYQSGSHRFN